MVDKPEESVSEPTRFVGAPRQLDHARVLGGPATVAPRPETAPQTHSRFQLSGVATAPATDSGAIALIAIDGRAARLFRVGETVDGDMVLRSVSPEGATLGPANGPATVMLEVATGAPAPRAVSDAGAGQRSSPQAGASPPTWGAADPMQRARYAAAGSLAPATVESGAEQPTTITTDDLEPPSAAVPKAATERSSSPGRRMRLRRLNSSP